MIELGYQFGTHDDLVVRLYGIDVSWLLMLLCDRRIWHKIDKLKSDGDPTAGSGADEDVYEDESAKWSWYIS